jgi:adenylate cyclase
MSMGSERLPRKLAAVLYADVAGYARATGEDEDGTHRLLSDYLDLFASAVARHGGRVMHYAGDALLATFAAAVDAMRTAEAVQDEVAARNSVLPPARRVEFRIGVNLGDVIEDRGDVYGNGVNVAARLASLADPGGICVADAVRVAVAQNLPLRYESIGEQALKNISEPVRAYRAVKAAADPGVAPQRAARSLSWTPVAYAGAALAVIGAAVLLGRYLPLAGPPEATNTLSPSVATPATDADGGSTPTIVASVAVLPFVNLSSDQQQEYFGDGVAEELLSVLANIEGLRVPSQTSSFKFKGSGDDLRTIAAALNVDHVLEGSVRKDGNRVRITAQLIDVATDSHVWSDRYERELTDVFAIQDEIAANVAAALRLELLGDRRQSFRTTNVEAHDALLLGLSYMRTQRAQDLAKATESFQRAIALDPNYAIAYVMLSGSLFSAQIYGHLSAEDASARARPAIARALELAPDLGEAYYARAQLSFFSRDFASAEADLRRAIALNGSYAPAHATQAFLFDLLNRPAEMRAALDKALDLDPLNALTTWSMGTLLLNRGETAEAAVYYRRATEIQPDQPNGYAGLGDVAIMQGRLDEGMQWYLKGLAQDPRQPHMTAIVGYLYRSLGDVERAQQWLDRAGSLLQIGSLPRFFREYSRLIVRREDARELFAILGEVPAQQITPLSPRLFRKAALATGDRVQSEAFLRRYWPELFTAEPVLNPINVSAAPDVAWVLVGNGERRQAQALLEQALALYRDPVRRTLQPMDWAALLVEPEALALQERPAEALAAMTRAVDSGWRMDWWQVESDPTLASIRADPQFTALLDRVKADLAQQLERVRELERDGTIPPPPPVQ